MNKLFVFYPHCYLKSTSNEVLVFDTLNSKHLYIKDFVLSTSDKESLQKGFVYVSDALDIFVTQCASKDMGYFVDYETKLPFMYNRSLDIVTSISKENRALGYNLSSHTNALLKEITILQKSDYKKYHNSLCLQLGIPKNDDCVLNINSIFHQLSSFPNLERIILSGKIDISQLSNALKYTEKKGIHLIHRLFFNHEDKIHSLQLVENHKKFSIEFIVDNSIDVTQINQIINDQVYVKAIVQSLEDLEKFKKIKNVIYVPVFSPNQRNNDILNQMLLSKEEILQTFKTINDCLISDYVNSDSFGKLVIEGNGVVSCLGDKIASIQDYDLSSIINTWVNSNNCAWFYTRQKKDSCAHCALQALCPPISIQEKLGYYKCPCKI